MAQYDSQAIVTIECGTTGAIIRYTLDGTNPSKTVGTEYSEPFTLYNNKTVKAIGIKSGLIDSDIAAAHSLIDNPEFVYLETDSESKVLSSTYKKQFLIIFESIFLSFLISS